MAGQSRSLLQIGDWVADPNLDTLARGAEQHKLEPRTMRLLLLLATVPGEVISVNRMLSEVWAGVIVGPASAYQAISQLRRLLGDADPEPTYIATVPRKGYRLVAAVRTLEALPAPAAEPIAPASAPRARRRGRGWLLAAGSIVLLAAALWLPVRHWLAADAGAPASIVVLPFIDLSADQKDQSFCDGLTEELSNWLAQIPTLRVVARTSAFAYRGQGVDVRTIGRVLGTTHVLEGSLRRSGNQLRITAQLVSTRDGYHLWSANFDRAIGDVVQVQEEIARSVADNLEIRLTEQTGERFAARRGGTPAAYQLYLLARHHEQELTRDANDRAIDLYQQALAQDQNFALAYAGLAYAYLNQPYLNGLSIGEVAPKSEALIEAGMRLDPGLPELYTARGALRSDQGRKAEALADLRHAIDLNPNDAQALAETAYLYLLNAQPRAALASYDAAAALDPLNFNLHARRCVALTDLDRVEQADGACAHARELAPSSSWAYEVSSWLDFARGRSVEALKWNQLALKASPNEFTLYKDRTGLMLSLGLSAQARTLLEQARSIAGNDEAIDVRQAQISYYERGLPALRAAMQTGRFEQSPHADTLLLAARLELLLQQPAAAQRLLQRALSSADIGRSTLDTPWMQRDGESNELTLAEAEQALGQTDAARQRLQQLRTALERFSAEGVERFGVYQLRARVLALLGDADDAMTALTHAAMLGWRDTTQAEHDPALLSLQARSDYRQLIERLNRENAELRRRATSAAN